MARAEIQHAGLRATCLIWIKNKAFGSGAFLLSLILQARAVGVSERGACSAGASLSPRAWRQQGERACPTGLPCGPLPGPCLLPVPSLASPRGALDGKLGLKDLGAGGDSIVLVRKSLCISARLGHTTPERTVLTCLQAVTGPTLPHTWKKPHLDVRLVHAMPFPFYFLFLAKGDR